MYGLLTPLVYSFRLFLTPFGISFISMFMIPWGIITLKRLFE